MQRTRTINHELHQVSEYTSVSQFLKSERILPGISTIYDGGVPIDLLVSPGASSTTICFFHGAIEDQFTLPVLSGLGISGGLEANRVFISDPSLVLDNNLMLSWYAGNIYQPDLQVKLTKILSKIFKALKTDKLVFFGGSGGGFAALFFAQMFSHSWAIVFNPQTNIRRYKPSAVRQYMEKAFCMDTEADKVSGNLPSMVKTNLCDLYEGHSNTRIAYMQNCNDDFHIESHLLPFVSSINPETEIFILLQPWAEGHSPPPKSVLTRVLDVAASESSTSEGLMRMGFRKLIPPRGSGTPAPTSIDELNERAS